MKFFIAFTFVLFNFQNAFGEITADMQAKVNKINAKLADITDAKCNMSHIGNTGKDEKAVIYYKKKHGMLLKYSTQPISFLITPAATVYYDSKLNQKSAKKTGKDFNNIFASSLNVLDKNFEISNVFDRVNDSDGLMKTTIIAKSKRGNKVNAESDIAMSFDTQTSMPFEVNYKEFADSPNMTIKSCIFETLSEDRFKSINIGNENI